MRKVMKKQVAVLTTVLVACMALSSCSSGSRDSTKQLKLEGVEAYTGMGESKTKALAALEDIKSFVTNQVTKGVPLASVSLDSMNLNMRTTTIVGPQDAAKFYGGLPNVASVQTGKTFVASAPSSGDVCLYLRLTTGKGTLVAERGVSRDSFCRAGDPITEITWAAPNTTEWPDGTTTKLPSLAEYKAYAARHPGESVIPEGYTDAARSNKPGQTSAEQAGTNAAPAASGSTGTGSASTATTTPAENDTSSR